MLLLLPDELFESLLGDTGEASTPCDCLDALENRLYRTCTL